MTKYTKPEVNKVWAESGTKTKPLDSKIATGWVVEKPKFENMNWVQNRQDSFQRYINQLGLPEWDDKTPYVANQSYVQGTTTGTIYRCILSHGGVGNTPQNPEADVTNTYWVVAFDVGGAAAAVAANLATLNSAYPNLTGVNAGNARNTLSVYSKAYIDALFAAIPTRVGEVALCAGNTPKVGTLQLKGQLVSRTTYAALWAYAQTSGNITANDAAWGATTTPGSFSPGDGSTTFRLPDLRGIFIRGWADDGATDLGRAIGSYQDDDNKAHTHANGRGVAGTQGSTGASLGDGRDFVQTSTPLSTTGTESRPKNAALMYCIYY